MTKLAIEPQPHRQKEENRQSDLRTAEGKNLIVPVISPHDGRHRQQGQVLEECFPGGEFDRLTETAAILDRDERHSKLLRIVKKSIDARAKIDTSRIRTLQNGMQPIIISAPHSQIEKTMLAAGIDNRTRKS